MAGKIVPPPMTLPRATSPIPLYHQVFTILSQRISDGTYASNDKFATEDQLTAEFKVSRATIRQALDEMEREGLIVRRQGRGTFVATAHANPVGQRFRGSLADLQRERGRVGVGEVEAARSQEIPVRIARTLGLSGRVATVIRRIRLIDGQVFAFAVTYLPERYGRLLSQRDLTGSSLMHALRRRGVELVRARQSIRAQIADTTVSQRLRVHFGAPVLFVERVVFGRDGQPVEFVQAWYRGDVYEYSATLDLPAAAGRDIGAQLA
jgi:GntR family transcriptional regulator